MLVGLSAVFVLLSCWLHVAGRQAPFQNTQQQVLTAEDESMAGSAKTHNNVGHILRGTAQGALMSEVSWETWDPSFRFASLPGAGDCLGLAKSMCKPCPAPEQNSCDAVTKSCNDLFCSPLCLKNAWNCTITVDASQKAFVDAVTDKEKKALCAQVTAWACAEEFKCCTNKAELFDWVEGFAYLDKFPAPLFPFAPCMHDPGDATASKSACDNCKAALGIKLQATPEKCAFGADSMPNAAGDKGGQKKDGKVVAKKGGGSMKSFEERCTALSNGIAKKIASLTSSVTKRLCGCAGCCDPPDNKPDDTCYFPITRKIV